ncbi:hypothetical protein RP726_00655 [Candidatus Methylospira mobilis]|nr:hypothetical protein [Candidatus Methylospira mobilis]WNV04939.1 hypothetical protein RP726_00655 [Candidatus Methylospira mobilis]
MRITAPTTAFGANPVRHRHLCNAGFAIPPVVALRAASVSLAVI